MNLRDALKYTKENYKTLDTGDTYVLGVAYTPTDDEATFQIIKLSYDYDSFYEDLEDEFDETDEDGGSPHWFAASLEGGHLLSSEGIEDSFGSETIDGLMADMPDFSKDLNYQAYTLKESYLGRTAEYALKAIFPELPSIDDHQNDFNLSAFKAAAIKLLSTLNA
ncbi:hypothetical protein ACTXIV_02675 [Psychrobacter celer]|uniref:hypothetical protein n=1 Tax=Psychrobacter celer TaxID=306572 RepID=UPI003FD2384B